MRQNIFNGKTFAILEESFINADLKDDDDYVVSVQEKIKAIEKVIIENSGRVIDNTQQSKYLILEDGFDPKIWDEESQTDCD